MTCTSQVLPGTERPRYCAGALRTWFRLAGDIDKELLMKNICIEMWPVEKLIPYPNAIRKNDHAVRRMISLIQEFGFKLPLLIHGGGEIVDGHLRWKAAKKLKLAEVPVIHCDEWGEAQVRAFRLAVNRSASWAAGDGKVLTQEVSELQE